MDLKAGEEEVGAEGDRGGVEDPDGFKAPGADPVKGLDLAAEIVGDDRHQT